MAPRIHSGSSPAFTCRCSVSTSCSGTSRSLISNVGIGLPSCYSGWALTLGQGQLPPPDSQIPTTPRLHCPRTLHFSWEFLRVGNWEWLGLGRWALGVYDRPRLTRGLAPICS